MDIIEVLLAIGGTILAILLVAQLWWLFLIVFAIFLIRTFPFITGIVVFCASIVMTAKKPKEGESWFGVFSDSIGASLMFTLVILLIGGAIGGLLEQGGTGPGPDTWVR
ncbi:hypothetical protein H0Z60_20845 [Ectothiorhodospiraceae bacterium WFHF3C12]|nr:hypothetical protein [Ectothiorhodospiraceae bacterium WFHF3C12]